MDEKSEEKNSTTNTGEGDKPTTTPLIDSANEAAKRLEEANKVKAELLTREEELASKKMLGGQSEAGVEAKEPKEETAVEYKDRVMRGDIE